MPQIVATVMFGALTYLAWTRQLNINPIVDFVMLLAAPLLAVEAFRAMVERLGRGAPTARTQGVAGQGVRAMGLRVTLPLVITLVALWLLLSLLTKAGSGISGLWYLGGLVVLLFAMRIVMDQLESTSGRFDRGASGEESVGRILDYLGPEFVVLHDLDTGKGNVDHTVVGPQGLFVVETKSHKGKVTFDGTSLRLNGKPTQKDFLAQTYAEAKVVEERVRGVAARQIKAVPILVFSQAFVQVNGPVRGVEVLPAKWIAKRIQDAPVLLDVAAVEGIAWALGWKSD